jgi:hypothetical protein
VGLVLKILHSWQRFGLVLHISPPTEELRR